MDADSLLIHAFVEKLVGTHQFMYGGRFPSFEDGQRREIINHCARTAGGLISTRGDTPGHDLLHMVDVGLVGQEILKGKHTLERVDGEDWFNFILACIYHDIGYIRDLFPSDKEEILPGATGASLVGEHVQRSMEYVTERFAQSDLVDGEAIAELIGFTQVPIINPEDTTSYGALLRAADYIAHFYRIDIRRRSLYLLSELREAGLAGERGYETVDDVIKAIPDFFDNTVKPLIVPALTYLERTTEGSEIMRSLYGTIKLCEILTVGQK